MRGPSWAGGGWGERDRGPGRVGVFWIAIWTFFLLDPLHVAWQRLDTVAGWAGVLLTLAFGVWYVGVFVYQRRTGMSRSRFHLPWPQAVVAIGIAMVLAVADCVAIGQVATACAVYLCVLFVMALPTPYSVVLAFVNAGAWYVAGLVVPGWDLDNGMLLSMLTASAAVFGLQQMILGNIALRRANDDNQRLAVADERNRFARDLHDILGHSLTVITVKAELANRLLDADPERARSELADLERLSRDALTDVRRAVEGYRELTLPGELTRARTALRAAEIEAELPTTTDEIPGDLRELYAWTVREGVTNVIRHSGAQRCVVRLSPNAAEVCDDGCGPAPQRSGGNGLVGLRERAAALGATVVTRDNQPRGFSLQVVVPQ